MRMKKIIATGFLTVAIAGATFAQGLTQYDLAELLMSKAQAENLIEQRVYTEDEVLALVKDYELFELTSPSDLADISLVRKTLSDYEVKKLNLDKSVESITENEEVVSKEETYKALESEDRKLSHEFMSRIYDEQLGYDEDFKQMFGSISEPIDNTFHYDEDVYPLINKYRYELYRIFGWYAQEYDLYVRQTTSSVALYRRKKDVVNQNSPLIVIGFSRNPTDDNYDGIGYSIRIKVNSLYKLKYNEELTLAENRERIVAIGYQQPHLVMALRDASSLFIKDEVELNEFVTSYVADVVENEDKEFSYDKDRHEVFGNKRYFISKIQGFVVYFIDHDLSLWED